MIPSASINGRLRGAGGNDGIAGSLGSDGILMAVSLAFVGDGYIETENQELRSSLLGAYNTRPRP